MTELLYDGDITLHAGDCVQVLRDLPDASIDAVVTDPPYSLEFMASAWDRHSDYDDDPAFGYYLSGLIDGEGCFRVHRSTAHSAHGCEFSLKLRSDDEAILISAQRWLGIGAISDDGPREGSHAQKRWKVSDKAGCQRLVDLLDKYPLRAKKAIDYAAWREAVIEWTNMPRGNRWHGPSDQSRMAALKQRIENGRRFVDPPWSGNGYQDWCRLWAVECLRVLRPGGHMLAFGGTRTYHRLTCAVEDAGFEVRDSITWLYGSGFPKSLDVSKAIRGTHVTTAASRAAAVPWQGWGTALKPASEPILVARKPLTGTVAGNVLTHGVGALNIDGCRTEFTSTADERESKEKNRHGDFGTLHGGNEVYGDYTTLGERDNYDAQGRWPANVLLTHAAGCVQVGERTVSSDSHHPAARPAGGIGNDGHAGQGGLVERSARAERVADWRCEDGCPVAELDAQSGVVQGRIGMTQHSSPTNVYGRHERTEQSSGNLGRIDVGGASRFFPTFRYEPKAGSSERPRVAVDDSDLAHPTVKPLELMRWLVRLLAPRGALVLDPFAGSGTTGEACLREGMRCVLIERDERYLPLIRARLTKPQQETLL